MKKGKKEDSIRLTTTEYIRMVKKFVQYEVVNKFHKLLENTIRKKT